MYFVRRSSPHLVTGANMFDPAKQENLLQWAAVVDTHIATEQVDVVDTMEVYLEPDEDGVFCRYYIIDHASCVLFWFENLTTEEIGIRPVVSRDHLRERL